MHGCVHSWMVHVLNQAWDCDLARLAMKLVGSHIPIEQAVWPWLKQQRLLQHATRCVYMLLNILVSDNEMAWECHKLELLYADQGKLVEAEQMYQRALLLATYVSFERSKIASPKCSANFAHILPSAAQFSNLFLAF